MNYVSKAIGLIIGLAAVVGADVQTGKGVLANEHDPANASERLAFIIPPGWVLVKQEPYGDAKNFVYLPEGQTLSNWSDMMAVLLGAVANTQRFKEAFEGLSMMTIAGDQAACETKVTNSFKKSFMPGQIAISMTVDCTKKKVTGKSVRTIHRDIISENGFYTVVLQFTPIPSTPSKEWEERLENVWPCSPAGPVAKCPETPFTLK